MMPGANGDSGMQLSTAVFESLNASEALAMGVKSARTKRKVTARILFCRVFVIVTIHCQFRASFERKGFNLRVVLRSLVGPNLATV